MKKYIICAMAIATALTFGCGRRSANNSGGSQSAPHEHVHAPGEGHYHHDETSRHVHGEGCTHDHAPSEAHHHEHGAGCDHDHGNAAADHVHGENCDHAHDHDHGHQATPQNAKLSKRAARKASREAAFASCSHGHSEGNVGADSDEIVFPAEQAARTEFEVQPAARGNFREVIKCGGQVMAAQGEVSIVSAPVSGVVTFADSRIMTSSLVRNGQGLFHISSASLASGDAALKARLAFEQTKNEFERAQRLRQDGIVSETEYLSARTAYYAAQSEYEPLRNINQDGSITVSAPAAGYISQMSVSAGDYVEMGQPLAAVARSGRMQLRAMVSQRYYGRLPEIADANFRVPSSESYYNVASLGGGLSTAGRVVSQGSALTAVVFDFDGAAAIPDGAYAEVSLLGRERANVLTLPISAITEQQGLYYVYVQLDAEHYSRHEVKLGADDGRRVEILSGIEPGDRVVTKGAINVKMAAASGTIPHGHTH